MGRIEGFALTLLGLYVNHIQFGMTQGAPSLQKDKYLANFGRNLE